MKDPDFEVCKFIALPPDEERREVKKKKRSSTFQLVLAMVGTALVAGCMTWTIKSYEQQEVFAAFDGPFDERYPRNLGGVGTCQELGSQLGSFDSDVFDHMNREPQCLEQIQPKLTLYTKSNSPRGCDLTQQDTSLGNAYYEIPADCQADLSNLNKVVFLVHGFSLGQESTDEYESMKKATIKAEGTGAIIVDWHQGSSVDLTSLKGSTASTIFSELINLGPYHQAAANTRYVGAALAIVTENIRKIKTPMTTHCIGHSLGAHVCGFLGKTLHTMGAEKLNRITGLDPAGPLFLDSKLTVGMTARSRSSSAHLAPEDAVFVDTIHTDSTWLGSFQKTGHQDFYVGQSLTRNDGVKEDKFGYSQPMVEDCLMGSHSISRDIFLATVEDQGCSVGEVCTSINENITESCHAAANVKFGYNMDGSSLTPGIYPVPSDKSNIKCANNKNIKVEAKPLPATVKAFQKIVPGDICSFVQTLVTPVREVLNFLEEGIREMIEKTNEQMQAQKVALKEKLEELLRSATVLDSVPGELFDIHEEVQRIEALYRGEKNTLRNLARRTKSEAGTMARAIRELIENGTTGVKIPWILKRIKKLLSYSDTTLKTAHDNLDKIKERFEKVATKLMELEIKIMQGKQKVDEYIKSVEAGMNATKEEKNNVADIFAQTFASLEIATGLAEWGSGFQKGSDKTEFDQVVGAGKLLTNLGQPILTLIEEHMERGKENRIIEMYKNTKEKVEQLQEMYQKHIDDIRKSKTRVEEKKKDIESRRRIVSLWLDVVVEVIDSNEDWSDLEDSLKNPEDSKFMLEEAATDFEQLRDVAIRYIEYDEKIENLPLPDMP